MKKCFLIVLFFIIALFFAVSQADAYVFIEGWNIDATPSNAGWGVIKLAWQYIPTSTYDLSRIEFYSAGQDRAGMSVELRDNEFNTVGQSLLTSGTFHHISARSWQGADLTPYTVTENQTYWVVFYPSEDLFAHITFDQGAQTIPYRGMFSHTPTHYTSFQDGYKPMVKFYGGSSVVPEPVTMSLMGMGLLGFGIIKRRNKIV